MNRDIERIFDAFTDAGETPTSRDIRQLRALVLALVEKNAEALGLTNGDIVAFGGGTGNPPPPPPSPPPPNPPEPDL